MSSCVLWQCTARVLWPEGNTLLFSICKLGLTDAVSANSKIQAMTTRPVTFYDPFLQQKLYLLVRGTLGCIFFSCKASLESWRKTAREGFSRIAQVPDPCLHCDKIPVGKLLGGEEPVSTQRNWAQTFRLASQKIAWILSNNMTLSVDDAICAYGVSTWEDRTNYHWGGFPNMPAIKKAVLISDALYSCSQTMVWERFSSAWLTLARQEHSSDSALALQ